MLTAKISHFCKILDEEPTKTHYDGLQSMNAQKAPTGGNYAERKARAALYVNRAGGVCQGERNAAAYGLAARIREKFGLDEHERLELLREWNIKNIPPLTDNELQTACRNPDKYGQRPSGAGYQPLRTTAAKAAATEKQEIKPIESLPLIQLSTVEPEPISWQWPNRFPNKAINLIPGMGSAGKTTFAAYLMGRLTTGRNWFDCENTIPPGTCLFIGDEDDLACAIRPKLDAAEADVSKVVALDYDNFFKAQGQTFNLDEHTALLDKTIESLGDVRAVFFDPLNGYLGRINSHNDGEARSVLIPLQNIAKKYDLAIYGLCHLNKKSDLAAIDRVLGSVAFVNTARSVWFVSADQSGVRYLTCEKGNYCIEPTNLAFKIIDGAVAFIEGTTEKTAADVLQGGIQKADSTVECIEWLRKKLAYNSCLSSEISEEARHCGFSDHALRTAKRTLNVQSKPNGIGGKWMLSLPEKGDNLL